MRARRLALALPVVVVSFAASQEPAAFPGALGRGPQTAAQTPARLTSPEDDAAVRALVSSYYEAYARGDLEATMACWHKSAPGLLPARVALVRAFARQQFAFTALTISRLSADVSGGSARVVLEVTITETSTSQPRTERWFRDQSYLKQDGLWRLWRDESAASELALKMVAAGSDEVRESLLAADADLVGTELIEELIRASGRVIVGGRLDHALELTAHIEALARRTGNQAVVAHALATAGSARTFAQRWDEAFEKYREAGAISTEIGDRHRAATCDLNMGHARYAQQRYPEAAEFYRTAVDAFERLGDEQWHGSALHSLGNASYMAGDLTRALEAYERSLDVHTRSSNPYGAATALQAIGLVRKDQGDYAAALDAYEQCLARYRASRDRAGEVHALQGLVDVFRLQGHLDRALEHAHAGLAVAESIGDRAGVAELTFDTGLVYAAERRWPEALAAYQRSLAIEERLGSQERIARAHGAIGTVLFAQSKPDDAIAAFRVCLSIREAIGDTARVAWTLAHIGMALEAKARHDEALETYGRALAAAEAAGGRNAVAIVRALRAEVFLAQGGTGAAFEEASGAAALAESLDDLDSLAHAHLVAGRAQRAAGDPAKARASLEAADRAVERQASTEPELAAELFFADSIAPPAALADLLAAEGRVADAFLAAERAKVRRLRACLGRVGARVSKGLSADERDAERQAVRELVSVTTQVQKERGRPSPDPSRLSSLENSLAATRTGLEALRRTFYEQRPGLEVLRARAEVPDLADLMAHVAKSGAVVLEYIVNADRLLGFVLTPGKRAAGGSEAASAQAPAATAPDIVCFKIAITPSDLASRIRRFRDAIEKRDDRVADQARALYDLLLKPAEARLPARTPLLIVPDGVLWALPFEAMVDGTGRYLVESRPIGYLASLSASVWMAGDTRSSEPASLPPATVLAFGNPAIGADVQARLRQTRPGLKLDPMPEAEREVRLLGTLYGPTRSAVAVGARAAKDRLVREGRAHSILHLAVPAALSDAGPMYSKLALAPAGEPARQAAENQPASAAAAGASRPDDGTLTVADITAWDITADRVILSRAGSDTGPLTTGEAFVGLGWAAFVAGCRSVVVSRWAAESHATPALMAELHREMLPKASAPGRLTEVPGALRRAVLRLRRDPALRHPYFWAGFVVLGG